MAIAGIIASYQNRKIDKNPDTIDRSV